MPLDPTSEFASASGAAAAKPPAGRGPRAPGGAGDTSFFGHPRGLSTLFFTELFERFSYYGMRALLILYMTAAVANGGLGFDATKAGAIYGLYGAGVYLLALPGGWIADKLIGQRRAVLIGGIIIALGHFSLALDNVQTFYAGLVLIVIGTGLLKPNISTMVGELYPEGGARRDAGFSIFYMGINLGAFIAPLVTSSLGASMGWHIGFGAAGVGMVFGIIQYVLGGRHLGEAGLYPDTGADPKIREGHMRALMYGVGVVIALVAIVLVLRSVGSLDISITQAADVTGVVIVSLAILYFIYMFFAGGLDSVERKRVTAIFVLFIFSALFWSGFEQAGSSLNLMAERRTNLNLFGWEMPAGYLQSVNALFIIMLAPVFAWLWLALARRNAEPSSPGKFTLGLVFLGLGFAVMILAAQRSANGVMVSPMYLVVTYLLHTIGELCLSPVGLSTVTKLAPHRMVGQMMGVWFMSISLGNLMAGRVAGQFETLPLPQLFGAVTATTLGGGVILALLIIPIKRLMSGVK
jgi:POT family proton-dependent oligopeptide transporter